MRLSEHKATGNAVRLHSRLSY